MKDINLIVELADLDQLAKAASEKMLDYKAEARKYRLQRREVLSAAKAKAVQQAIDDQDFSNLYLTSRTRGLSSELRAKIWKHKKDLAQFFAMMSDLGDQKREIITEIPQDLLADVLSVKKL